jgi:hypothetical protein
MGNAIGRRGARATTLGCWSRHFGVFTIVIVVLVDIHVSCSWLMLLRPFLFGCFRHARRWRSNTHCRKRRRMVSSFRRMITIVESSSVWSAVRAVTGNLRGWRWVWRSWPTAVRLLKLLTLLFIGRRLGVDVIVVFPFAVSFRRCSWRTVITIACSGFGSYSRRWRGGTTRDAAARRVVRMVLVRSLITVARGAWAMFDDWSNFGWRTGWTPVRERRSLARALG